MIARDGTASDERLLDDFDDLEDFDDLGERAAARLKGTFRSERMAGLRLATVAGIGALAAVAVLLLVLSPPPWLYGYLLGVALLATIMLAHYWTQRAAPDRVWISYLFVGLMLLVLTFTGFVPDLVLGSPWPIQMFLRSNPAVYYFVLIALVSLNYSPGLMLWAGFVSVIAWAATVTTFAYLPDAINSDHVDMTMPPEEILRIVLDPKYVALDLHLQDLVIMLVVTAILAASVARARRLVLREALVERERGNLARYFPPQIVDRLSQSDDPLSTVREQEVAVLFADIVGFTELAEPEEPEQVIALLRSFHRRLEQAVFSNGGTLDKFLGDGLMATFGTPHSGDRDALNALAAAHDMHRAIGAWNRERETRGHAIVRLSLGLHYGPVVLGDIGSERRLEFAVLGDAVNVASRLESLTRELACGTVISDALACQARRDSPEEAEALLAAFRPSAPQSLRGRAGQVAVWIAD